LLLGFSLAQQQNEEQEPAAATLLLPLHAKYPQPQAAQQEGWRAALTGGGKRPALSDTTPLWVGGCAARTCSLLAVLLASSKPGHAAALVPWPWLVANCSSKAGGGVTLLPPPAALLEADAQQQQQLVSSSQQQQVCNSANDGDGASLLWPVPAGELAHLQLVSWGTLLVTAACCAAVSWTAVRAAMATGV
jgi:hypothetical protein